MKSFVSLLNIIGIIITAIFIFAIGFRAGQKYDIALDENNDYVAISYSVNEQKIRRLMSLIDNHYVDKVNTDSLVDNTIKYVLSNLDPHSVYLEEDISNALHQKMKGYYIGIGIEYTIYNDTILITRVNPKSPNASNIQFADKIIEVNDIPVTGKDSGNANTLIKGKDNTTVNLSILRDNQIVKVTAKRAVIADNTVTDSYMITEDIGYIKLQRFGENSYAEFKSALNKLKTKGMNSLIFDLRGNGGGLMVPAEKIADEFLTKNQLIVFTKDSEGKKQMFYATDHGDFDGKPIYVLIDEASASASEIIAGAIQDNDAGIIIGRRSFGKGLVQREISLGDGTKLRLTTARYFTPSGRSIQKPYTKGSKNYMNDLHDRFARGEMYSLDSIKTQDSLVYKTSKGRKVYGGGGIIPDIFIPLDSLKYSVWYYKYRNQNLFQQKILKYIQENKTLFQQLKEDHFISYFNPKPLAKELIDAIPEKEINWDAKEEEDFMLYIKTTIADYIYGKSVAQQIWINQDPMIYKVIELEGGKK